MTGKTLSELLILFLLFLSCSRFIFIKNVKQDSLSVVPFFAFIVSILNFFAFGLSAELILVSMLSFFVMIWNVRAVLRFFSKLVIDHYSFLFIFISSVNLILVILTGIFVFHFSPKPCNLKKYNTQVETIKYTGNFKDGFKVITNPLQKNTALLYKYTNSLMDYSTSQNKIILFIPPKTATQEIYLPFFAKLSKDGFIVYSAEFYDSEERLYDSNYDARFLRRAKSLAERLKSQKNFSELLKAKQNYLFSEFETLIKLSGVTEEDEVFIVTEEDLADILPSVYSTYIDLIDGGYDLATAHAYTTRGYGPVENTDPFIAYLLKQKKDNTFYMSSHIALEMEKALESFVDVKD